MGLALVMERSRIEQYLSPDLQYACHYWVQHLQRSGARVADDCQVHKFLQKHLLHWLEALSLMRKTSEGVLAITSLESMVTVSDSLSAFKEVIAAPSHAYIGRILEIALWILGFRKC